MNHLLIGFGQTGRKVLQHFENLRQQAVWQGSHFVADCLAVDVPPLSDHYPTLLLAGQAVNPYEDQRMQWVPPPTVVNALTYLKNHPWLRPSANEMAVWEQLIRQASARSPIFFNRRISRYSCAESLAVFLERVDQSFTRMRLASGHGGLNIHLVLDLGDPVVSGTIIDVLVQLRQRYPSVLCQLMLYAYLPQDRKGDKYRTERLASAYAALLELKHLSDKTWLPDNVLQAEALMEDDVWFNACYFMQHPIHVSAQEKPAPDNIDPGGSGHDALSVFLLRRISVGEAQWHESFPIEQQPITIGDEAYQSRPFLSFSSLRLSFDHLYPQDYFSSMYLKQTLSALLYRHWQPEQGFVHHSGNLADFDVSVQDLTAGTWLADMGYLRLNKLMSNEAAMFHTRWPSVEEAWQNQQASYLEQVLQAKQTEWFDSLHQLFEQFFQQGYRNEGVHAFYQRHTQQAAALALHMVRSIEQSLLQQWLQQQQGLFDLGHRLEAMVAEMEGLHSRFNFERAQNKRVVQDYLTRLQDVQPQWAETGLLSKWLPSQHGKLQEASQFLADLYTARTQVAALGFTDALLTHLKERLKQTQLHVKQLIASLEIHAQQTNHHLAQYSHLTEQSVWLSQYRQPGLQQLSVHSQRDWVGMANNLVQHQFELERFIKSITDVLQEQAQLKNTAEPPFALLSQCVSQSAWWQQTEDLAQAQALKMQPMLQPVTATAEEGEIDMADVIRQLSQEKFEHLLAQIATSAPKPPFELTSSQPQQGGQQQGQASVVFVPEWAMTQAPMLSVLNQLKMLSDFVPRLVPSSALKLAVDLIQIRAFDLSDLTGVQDWAGAYQDWVQLYGEDRALFSLHIESQRLNWLQAQLIRQRMSRDEIREAVLWAGVFHLLAQDGHGIALQDGQKEPLRLGASWLSVVDELSVQAANQVKQAVQTRVADPKMAEPEVHARVHERLKDLLAQIKQDCLPERQSSQQQAWHQAGAYLPWARAAKKILSRLEGLGKH